MDDKVPIYAEKIFYGNVLIASEWCDEQDMQYGVTTEIDMSFPLNLAAVFSFYNDEDACLFRLEWS